MKIGIITVRDRTYHPNQRLGEAAKRRGHHVSLIHPYQVWPALGLGGAGLTRHPEWRNPDVVLPRQGATIGDGCLPLIRQFGLMGIPVVNTLEAVLQAKHQFFTLQVLKAAHISIPDTVFINSQAGFEPALKTLEGFPVVIKSASGRQGEGVFLVENASQAEAVLRERLNKGKGLLIQHYMPPAGRTDVRVFVLGGRVAGAMELTPESGDFRSNYHLTGRSLARALTPEMAGTALKSASAIGLEIAGVDLIVDQSGRVYVIEVNYAPGFRGLEAATGLDIADRIVRYLEDNYGERNPGYEPGT